MLAGIAGMRGHQSIGLAAIAGNCVATKVPPKKSKYWRGLRFWVATIVWNGSKLKYRPKKI